MDRRRRPETRKTYQVQELWQSHREIINLAATGMKQVEIAKVIGVTPQTVSNTLNCGKGSEKLLEIRESRDAVYKEVTDRISSLAPKALKIMERIMLNEEQDPQISPFLQLKAATGLLDRAGHSPVKKEESVHKHFHLGLDELEELKRRGREIGLVVKSETIDVN